MKKEKYIKPAMRVESVGMSQMLCGSGVRSLSTNIDDDNDGNDDFKWNDSGFGSSDDDR